MSCEWADITEKEVEGDEFEIDLDRSPIRYITDENLNLCLEVFPECFRSVIDSGEMQTHEMPAALRKQMREASFSELIWPASRFILDDPHILIKSGIAGSPYHFLELIEDFKKRLEIAKQVGLLYVPLYFVLILVFKSARYGIMNDYSLGYWSARLIDERTVAFRADDDKDEFCPLLSKHIVASIVPVKDGEELFERMNKGL
jgi:hypothetical protein